MSVSGIASSSFPNYSSQNVQNRFTQFRQEFQQLGQDLQAGDLAAAQQDFAALQQLGSQNQSGTARTNSITKDFNQLSQDLQAGDITAAQKDFAQVQQDFQNLAARGHHHRHHRGANDGGTNPITQLFNQLGQALQAGNIADAQNAYTALQQDFAQLGQSSEQSTTANQPVSSGVSVNA